MTTFASLIQCQVIKIGAISGQLNLVYYIIIMLFVFCTVTLYLFFNYLTITYKSYINCHRSELWLRLGPYRILLLFTLLGLEKAWEEMKKAKSVVSYDNNCVIHKWHFIWNCLNYHVLPVIKCYIILHIITIFNSTSISIIKVY